MRLQEGWISQAAAMQRRGRAGRVRYGGPGARLLSPCPHFAPGPAGLTLPACLPPPPPSRPGVCFRMFSRAQWQQMPSHTSPEMLRSPLESVCLLIKGMALGAPHDNNTHTPSNPVSHGPALSSTPLPFSSSSSAPAALVSSVLSQCLSPPRAEAVQSAVQLLAAIGAFSCAEDLTALGHHLKSMPMDPRVGESGAGAFEVSRARKLFLLPTHPKP